MTGGFSLPVAIDVLVAVLLVVTIAYAVMLNRKLTALRNAKGEMEAVVAQFAQATAQAENGIQTLKAYAAESGASLDTTVNRAHGLADDLSFLIERGNSLADRLEGALEAGRGKGANREAGLARSDRPQGLSAQGLSAKVNARVAPRTAPPVADVSPEETVLLNALRGVR